MGAKTLQRKIIMKIQNADLSLLDFIKRKRKFVN